MVENFSGNKLLEVSNLTVKFKTNEGILTAIDNVSFTLSDGEILGLIGESGSGKSTIASSILGLLANNSLVSGSIQYMGQEVTSIYEQAMNRKAYKKSMKMIQSRLAAIRWKEISMIFQGAMNAFNPVHTIRNQIHEVFQVHNTFDQISQYNDSDFINERVLRARAHEFAVQNSREGDERDLSTLEEQTYQDLLKKLRDELRTMSVQKKRRLLETNRMESCCITAGFNLKFLDSYPHELSGGMKQRGIIAMALALNPKIIIADEPTTGLDVITQAKIIKELKNLKNTKEVKSMIVISHDVGVVSQLANYVAVMYAGRMMEYGTPSEIFLKQRNPYTYALLKSYPSMETTKERIYGIPGAVPNLIDPPTGCYFASRCFMAEQVCFTKKPEPKEIEPGHFSLCHFDSISKEKYEEFNSKQIRESSFNVVVSNKNDVFIETNELSKYFTVHSSLATNLFGGANKPVVHAVDKVDIKIPKGSIVGVVGESGSGKTTLGKLLVNAIDPTSGSILFNLNKSADTKTAEGELPDERTDITKLMKSSRDYNYYRKEAQLIFQDPYDSINPKMSVIDIVSEPLIIQRKLIKERRSRYAQDETTSENGKQMEDASMQDEVIRALDISNLRPAENYLQRYPHELSGGERQRVSIARVITLNPMFIVADEPISMLDVSIRANIMNIILNLREKYNTTVLYISHDIASARYISDFLIIMYLGQVVESGPTDIIIKNPSHPYTKSLISAVPTIDPSWSNRNLGIVGEIGNAINPKKGCRFYGRCVYRQSICKDTDPPIITNGEQEYLCHFTQDQLISNGKIEEVENI